MAEIIVRVVNIGQHQGKVVLPVGQHLEQPCLAAFCGEFGHYDNLPLKSS